MDRSVAEYGMSVRGECNTRGTTGWIQGTLSHVPTIVLRSDRSRGRCRDTNFVRHGCHVALGGIYGPTSGYARFLLVNPRRLWFVHVYALFGNHQVECHQGRGGVTYCGILL
jgi:hypothetical protein